MDNDLLETVIQSAYDAGYKAGYAKRVEDTNLAPDNGWIWKNIKSKTLVDT